MYWTGPAYKTVQFQDKMAAIQSAAKATIQNNTDIYTLGVQWAPFDYTDYGNSCTTPINGTDSSYTEPDVNAWLAEGNAGTADQVGKINVHIHGYHPATWCGTGTGKNVYASTTAWPVYIVIDCPRGYHPVSEWVSGTPIPSAFPYQRMCVPNKGVAAVDATSPSNSNSPDCADSPTNGCATTANPVDISRRVNKEIVTDLSVAGPWPLAWSRALTPVEYAADWIFPGDIHAGIGRPATGGFSGKDVISVVRRQGSSLSFVTAPCSPTPCSGPRTWSVGVNPQRNLSQLRELWDDGALAGYALDQYNGVIQVFDVQGKLVRERNPSGQYHHYGYDAQG